MTKCDVSVAEKDTESSPEDALLGIQSSGLRIHLSAAEVASLSARLGQTYERFTETRSTLEREVSERTRGLEQTRKRLELVVDSISDALVSFSEDGKIESFNRAAQLLFGYDDSQVIAKPLSLIIPHFDSISELQGESVILSGKRSDGRYLHLEGSVRSMMFDEGTHYVAALRDLTNAKYTQKRLDEQAFLIEKSHSFVVTTNASGNILWCNPCFEQLTGYSLAQIAGEHYADRILSAETPQGTIDKMKKAAKEQRSHTAELVLMHATGRPFWIQMESHPMLDEDGEIEKHVAIGVDITEKKRLEKQQADFVAMVSHELRTPLTVVSGSLDAIEMSFAKNMPEMGRSLIDMGQRNCAHLSRLIEDLLDINKLEAGIIRFQSQSVSLEKVLQDAVETISSMAEKHGLSVSSNLETQDAHVFVDPQRLRQVMLNLLSNAVKFSHAGDTVEVTAVREDESVRFCVNDTGMGISAEFQSKVFQRFARDSEVQAEGIEGFGLGLSICKGLIEQMNGEIGFDSVHGEGTSFWVKLPLVHDDNMTKLSGN